MKKVTILAAIAIATGLASCQENVPTPVFKTDIDSLSDAMGMSNANGLKPYLSARMNVDTTYMGEFVRGFIKYVDATKPKEIAYMAGMQIGAQVGNQMIPGANNEIFGPNATKSINKEDFIKGFVAGTLETKGKMTPEEAMNYAQTTVQDLRQAKAAADSIHPAPSLSSAQIDSLSYALGLSNSQGLKMYLATRQNVDTTYMNDFVKGFKETAKGADEREMALMAGMQIGGQVANQILPMASKEVFGQDSEQTINKNNFIAGFVAGATGKGGKMTMDEATEVTTTKLSAIQEKALIQEFGSNKAAGEAFLAENAQKDGVITTPSGLQYRIISEGKGEVPAAGDMVEVNYEGTLIDGTEFDSSYKRGQSAKFATNQVIEGWQEALTMMPVGSVWEIVVPQDLAYGTRNQGTIKPFSTLIFKVELLGVEKK